MQFNPPFLLYLGDANKPLAIKTSRGIADWRPELCLGECAHADNILTLGLEKLTPKEAKSLGAKTFVVGLANSGGIIDASWVDDIVDALAQGLDIACGLHQKLSDIPSIAQAAKLHGGQLIDLRHQIPEVPIGNGQKRSGKRILTVGTDCSVGKMYTSLAIEREMQKQDFDAHFKATGQSGLLLASNGICIDAVVADFIAGAVELISPAADENHWDIIEGQGSLFNPSYAGVSAGLLHGAQADYLVMCHEAGRVDIKDVPNYKIPDLKNCIEQNLMMARLTNPKVQLAGISLNCRVVGEEQGRTQMKLLEQEFGVPCFDPMITGCANLVSHLKAIEDE
ncbi:N-acetyltransferase DgcN [Colwellia psychrerythraea]|uniref:EBNA-1 nuclear protein n=1 Tax=Colwellia psychrerythraea TaxID=28229 RepID=A0A099KL10_COLPS|nr:N-acetyltransferase DgcN [Colwellia psychrerythraea]KGJ90960.1 protein of unknown function DUF1611 [Colwellia psychrerythraea]